MTVAPRIHGRDLALEDRGRCVPRREEIDGLPSETLSRGTLLKPSVKLFELGGRRIVVKDFRAVSPWLRATVGRASLKNEVSAATRLAGIPGIPAFLGRIDRHAIAFSYVPGVELRHAGRRVDERFFRRLHLVVARMHRRGILHLDVGNSRNILRGSDGHPYLVDFTTALSAGRSRLGRLFVRAFRCIDFWQVLKRKRRHLPERLTVWERRQLQRYDRVRRFWIFKPLRVSRSLFDHLEKSLGGAGGPDYG